MRGDALEVRVAQAALVDRLGQAAPADGAHLGQMSRALLPVVAGHREVVLAEVGATADRDPIRATPSPLAEVRGRATQSPSSGAERDGRGISHGEPSGSVQSFHSGGKCAAGVDGVDPEAVEVPVLGLGQLLDHVEDAGVAAVDAQVALSRL